MKSRFQILKRSFTIPHCSTAAITAAVFALGTVASAYAQVHEAEVAKGTATGTDASASLYQTHCGACHQADGTGLQGAFPPLAGNPNVVDQPGYVIETVLNGKLGELSGMVRTGWWVLERARVRVTQMKPVPQRAFEKRARWLRGGSSSG